MNWRLLGRNRPIRLVVATPLCCSAGELLFAWSLWQHLLNLGNFAGRSWRSGVEERGKVASRGSLGELGRHVAMIQQRHPAVAEVIIRVLQDPCLEVLEVDVEGFRFWLEGCAQNFENVHELGLAARSRLSGRATIPSHAHFAPPDHAPSHVEVSERPSGGHPVLSGAVVLLDQVGPNHVQGAPKVRPRGGAPRVGPRKKGAAAFSSFSRHHFSLFFFLPARVFCSFLPLFWSFSWNFGGVFEALGSSNVHVSWKPFNDCTFGARNFTVTLRLVKSSSKPTLMVLGGPTLPPSRRGSSSSGGQCGSRARSKMTRTDTGLSLKIKVSSIVDQSSDREVTRWSQEELNFLRSRHRSLEGEDPMKSEEVSDDQLSVLCELTKVGIAPR